MKMRTVTVMPREKTTERNKPRFSLSLSVKCAFAWKRQEHEGTVASTLPHRISLLSFYRLTNRMRTNRSISIYKSVGIARQGVTACGLPPYAPSRLPAPGLADSLPIPTEIHWKCDTALPRETSVARSNRIGTQPQQHAIMCRR